MATHVGRAAHRRGQELARGRAQSAERRAEPEREVGVNTRHAGLISPAALLEDLVRVLARSAASEAHEASQTSKDEDSHEY
jgi:hypothetical protein